MALPDWYQSRYRPPMALNLRLTEDLARRVRDQAREEGRSQQSLIVDALELYLRDVNLRAFPPEVRHLITPPAEAFDPPGDRSRLAPDTYIPPTMEELRAILAELKGDR